MNSKNPAAESTQLPLASMNPKTTRHQRCSAAYIYAKKALGSTSYARVRVLPWRASMVGKRNSPVKVSKKAVMRFPSAGDGAASVSSPARWCSGEVRGAALGGDVSCVGGEKASGAGKKKAPPLPDTSQTYL